VRKAPDQNVYCGMLPERGQHRALPKGSCPSTPRRNAFPER
jgi:hypothetical protein